MLLHPFPSHGPAFPLFVSFLSTRRLILNSLRLTPILSSPTRHFSDSFPRDVSRSSLQRLALLYKNFDVSRLLILEKNFSKFSLNLLNFLLLFSNSFNNCYDYSDYHCINTITLALFFVAKRIILSIYY